MKQEYKDGCMNFLMDDHCDIAEMVGESLEKEIESFKELLREDIHMPEKITESTISSNTEQEIARIYSEKVKGTPMHELVELSIKADYLMKNFGYDMAAFKKAYMICRKINYKKD